jgi:hypothetical protein
MGKSIESDSTMLPTTCQYDYDEPSENVCTQYTRSTPNAGYLL